MGSTDYFSGARSGLPPLAFSKSSRTSCSSPARRTPSVTSADFRMAVLSPLLRLVPEDTGCPFRETTSSPPAEPERPRHRIGLYFAESYPNWLGRARQVPIDVLLIREPKARPQP